MVGLLHNGLFIPQRRRGVYWLRLYQLNRDSYLAVVTEVPGNPGMSVINAASMLRDEIAETFAIDQSSLDIFIIWPRRKNLDATVEPASFMRAPGSTNRKWADVSRKKIESLVGPLPPLPRHEALFNMVLASGGRLHEWDKEIWEAVQVADLPPFHAAYQCEHHARFKAMQAESRAHKHSESLEVGRRFIESLTPKDRAACKYHRANWRAIADSSVQIIKEVDVEHPEGYLTAAETSKLPTPEKRWLISLFRDPIVLSTSRKEYTNGQHRGCALRFSGAANAAVIVGFETVVDHFADWTYLGDG